MSQTLTLDLDLLVPPSEIDLPKQTTNTRIYLDFKILTLKEDETENFFTFLRKFTH